MKNILRLGHFLTFALKITSFQSNDLGTFRQFMKSTNDSKCSRPFYLKRERNGTLRKLYTDDIQDTINEFYDDSQAESQFGTKEYWQNTYNGNGDFPMDEYSWYYGFETIKPMIVQYLPLPPKQHEKLLGKKKEDFTYPMKLPKVLIPGVGNDGILMDLFQFGYTDLTAFDYCESAIERQKDLLEYNRNYNQRAEAIEKVKVLVRDGRKLDSDWTNMFDVVIEKGALDAIYLSGKGNIEKAVQELLRVIPTGGYMMSISGVVPEDTRKTLFDTKNWEWIRDGSHDLKAGCFVFRKR